METHTNRPRVKPPHRPPLEASSPSPDGDHIVVDGFIAIALRGGGLHRLRYVVVPFRT